MSAMRKPLVRRTAVAVGGSITALVLALVLVVSPGWAWWTDSASSTASITAYTLRNPVALSTSSNCSASNALLGSTITFHWTGVTPDASPAPQLANYEYELRFINRSNGSQLSNPVIVAHSGAAGSQQTYTNSASTLGGLLGLNLASQNNVTLQIFTHLKGTSWYGLTPVSINWTVTTLLGIATFTCNA